MVFACQRTFLPSLLTACVKLHQVCGHQTQANMLLRKKLTSFVLHQVSMAIVHHSKYSPTTTVINGS